MLVSESLGMLASLTPRLFPLTFILVGGTGGIDCLGMLVLVK